MYSCRLFVISFVTLSKTQTRYESVGCRADASEISMRITSAILRNQFISLTQISQISQRTHRYTRVCHPAANTRQGRQARAQRRAICAICEICVKFCHLCENILVRLPSVGCLWPLAFPLWASDLKVRAANFVCDDENFSSPKEYPKGLSHEQLLTKSHCEILRAAQNDKLRMITF